MTCTVEVLADSTADHEIRLTTLKLRYWRAIHGELMTHRVFSRNASSSRAIPVKKVLKQIWNDPALPIHWGANRSGMQADDELTGWRLTAAQALWSVAGKTAAGFAWGLMRLGLHKQVANRLLEPWQYITVIVSSTEWENFFELRCDEAAQPEIRELADLIRVALNHSTPRHLQAGEWHLPHVSPDEEILHPLRNLVKMSTARNARVSYLAHDGKEPSVAADIGLHDRLVMSKPIHASPAEHLATPLPDEEWCKNFRGWRQYRDYLEKGEQV